MQITVNTIRRLIKESTGQVAWIDNIGTLYVINESHDEWARKELMRQGRLELAEAMPTRFLVSEGWVLIDGDDFIGGLTPSSLSGQTRHAVADYAKNKMLAGGGVPEYWVYTPGSWSFKSSYDMNIDSMDAFLRWMGGPSY